MLFAREAFYNATCAPHGFYLNAEASSHTRLFFQGDRVVSSSRHIVIFINAAFVTIVHGWSAEQMFSLMMRVLTIIRSQWMSSPRRS